MCNTPHHTYSSCSDTNAQLPGGFRTPSCVCGHVRHESEAHICTYSTYSTKQQRATTPAFSCGCLHPCVRAIASGGMFSFLLPCIFFSSFSSTPSLSSSLPFLRLFTFHTSTPSLFQHSSSPLLLPPLTNLSSVSLPPSLPLQKVRDMRMSRESHDSFLSLLGPWKLSHSLASQWVETFQQHCFLFNHRNIVKLSLVAFCLQLSLFCMSAKACTTYGIVTINSLSFSTGSSSSSGNSSRGKQYYSSLECRIGLNLEP